MANSGREYEELVRDIQYSCFKAENIPSLKNINIEKNKKIKIVRELNENLIYIGSSKLEVIPIVRLSSVRTIPPRYRLRR